MYRLIISLFFIFWAANSTASDKFCFSSVAQEMNLDRTLLESISYVESRHNPSAVGYNKGSIDYGHMQINSYWIEYLGEDYLELDDPCYCTRIGAEILTDCINSYGYNRDALSCYNSGKPIANLSPQVKERVLHYINKVEKRYNILLEEKNG